MNQRILFIHGGVVLLLLFGVASLVQADVAADPAVVTTTPIIRVTTENPREINVGKPATFVFTVSNEGTSHASGVFVVINIPEYVELADSSIEPTRVAEQVYKFPVGELAPKTMQRVTLTAIPSTTDPIYLDSTVIFATSARAAVIVRRPELNVTANVTPQVVIGNEVDWKVGVTNTGDGPADDVIVTPSLVAGELQGKPLAQPVAIGSLKPGETKEVQFTVVPTLKGNVTAKFEGSNPDGLVASQESTFRVLRPELSVEVMGPPVQPISRESVYEIRVSNPGDAVTEATLVTAQVPAGLEITAATQNAYDRKNRKLRWRIIKLQPGATIPIRFRAESTTEGDQTINVTVQSDKVGEATATHTTSVVSRPNPVVTIINDQEYSAVGAPAGFRVVVVNAGSKAADGLRVRVELTDGLEAVPSADYEVSGATIEFPAHKLATGETLTLAFQAIGREVGEQRFRIMIDGVSLSRELTFEGSAYCYPVAETTSEQPAARSARRVR